MANIFDIPTKQTYVDTYVPLPFQAIAAVGDKIQKQNADTESAMSALENEISKLNVVGQVETRPGEFKSTGYKEHKDNLLNKTHVKIKQIVDDHLSGKIDANQFQSSFGNLQKEILGDYEKLKFASANSKTIDEQAKLVRTNPKVAEDSSVLNLHYKENQRLLDNPFSNEYMGAAIGTVVDEVEAVNKFVRDNKDQVLRYVNENKGGYHTQGYITGVSGERLRNEVHALFNEHEIGRQYRRRLDRAFDDGAYGTDEKGNPITFDTPTIITKKDKDGKVISLEKSTFGRDRMRENEEKFTQAVILKGVSETPHLSTNVDVFAQEKRAADREGQYKDPQNPIVPMDQMFLNKSGKIDLNVNNPFKEFGQFDDNGNFTSNNITMNNSLKELSTSFADPNKANPLDLKAVTSSAFGIPKSQKGQVILSNEKLKMVKNYYKNIIPPSFKGTVDEYIQNEAKRLRTDIDGIGNIAIGLMAKNYKEAVSSQKATPVFNQPTQESLTSRLLPSANNPSGFIINAEIKDMSGNNIVYEDNEDKIKTFDKSNIITGSNNLPGYFVVKLSNGNYVQANFQDPILTANHKDLIDFNNSISNTLKIPISNEVINKNNSSIDERYTSGINQINKELLSLDAKTAKSVTGQVEKAKESLKNWKDNYNKNIEYLDDNGYKLAVTRKINIGGQLQDVAVFNKYATNESGVDQKIFIVNQDGQFIQEDQANINAAIMPYLFQNNIKNALSTEAKAKTGTNLYN